MDSNQHLYYALGILAYAVAKADGKVQLEEKHMIHEIVSNEIDHNLNFNYAEIIFDLLQKDDRSFDQVYEWALNEMEMSKHQFTDSMKTEFVNVINKMAAAFPPNSEEEQALINQFEQDLKKLKTNL